MKRKLAILAILLVAVFVGVGIFQSLVPKQSWLIAAGTHIAENEQETKQFENKLDIWLEKNGFIKTEDPGGTHSWAGMHSPGESNEWYKGRLDGSEDFMIRVAKLPRIEVRDGWTEFSFYHSWRIRGSKSKIREAEKSSADIAENFIAWIEQTKMPNQSP